jgi:hypothetical protein
LALIFLVITFQIHTEIMKHLNRFSAAESYVLIQSEVVGYKELLQLTFTDLLSKEVLRLEASEEIGTDLTKEPYVAGGIALERYEPRDHERVFLSLFDGYNSMRVLRSYVMKIASQEGRGRKPFKEQIIKSNKLKPLFRKGFFNLIFGGFSLTNEGKQVRKELIQELEETEAFLLKTVDSDIEKARQVYTQLKANIFLMKGVSMNEVLKIEPNLYALLVMNQQKDVPDGSYLDYPSWSVGFDAALDDLDSDSSGDGDSSDSGGGEGGCGSGCGD